MAYELWTEAELAAELRDDRMDDVPNFFRSFFKRKFYSANKKILISELPAEYRYLAPFVLPTEEGKPISYEQAKAIQDFEPPYIKLKDPVTLQKALVPHVDEIITGSPRTPQDRFDERVVEVSRQHVRAIELRKEWMAAQALIKAEVHIVYDRDQGASYPEATIDFGRASNHHVVKTDNYWNTAATSILDDVETWSNRMIAAERGGQPGVMLVGTSVAPVFRKNTEILSLQHSTILGGQGTLFGRAQTLIKQGYFFIGTLPNGLEVWCYNEQFTLANGTTSPFLDPKEVVLIAPGYEGLDANGMIYDIDAWDQGGVSAEIYAKMWRTQGDQAAIFLGHQASPIPIPLHPNKTLRAQVLA